VSIREWVTKTLPLLSLFLFWGTSCITAEPVEVSFSVEPFVLKDYLSSSLPANARWSFSAAYTGSAGPVISMGNTGDKALMPASIMKLFVLAAVMDLTARERIELSTDIAVTGEVIKGELRGDLYIRGRGNAFLSTSDLAKASEALTYLGIRKISGDIIADESFFDAEGWRNHREGPSYAPPGALGLDLHTVSITVDNLSSKVTIEPPNDAVRIIFLTSGRPDIRQVDDFTYEVSGSPHVSPYIRRRFALNDPALYAGWTLKTVLRKKGIDVKGAVKKGRMSAGSRKIHTIEVEDLSDMIRAAGTYSINVAADNLLLLLGALRFGPPGTLDKGRRAMLEFLDKMGLPAGGVAVADGSGMASANRTTSEYVVRFLRKASAMPWFETFRTSLPRPGMDGTLRDMVYRNGLVRVKTGRLEDVYCLAGYVDRRDGKRVAFAYMVNVPGAGTMDLDVTGAEVLKRLAGGEY